MNFFAQIIARKVELANVVFDIGQGVFVGGSLILLFSHLSSSEPIGYWSWPLVVGSICLSAGILIHNPPSRTPIYQIYIGGMFFGIFALLLTEGTKHIDQLVLLLSCLILMLLCDGFLARQPKPVRPRRMRKTLT